MPTYGLKGRLCLALVLLVRTTGILYIHNNLRKCFDQIM